MGSEALYVVGRFLDLGREIFGLAPLGPLQGGSKPTKHIIQAWLTAQPSVGPWHADIKPVKHLT